MSSADELELGPSQKLLRSFSGEFQERNPGDVVGRGLAAKVAVDRQRERYPTTLRDQWDLFLLDARDMALSSIPNEELILLEQSRKLYKSWNNFRKVLPNDQRQDLDQQPPSMRYLFNSVKAASKTWQQDRDGSKTGRLKKLFADLCRNCSEHSALLRVIPSDDKYVCLLTGSLAAIAQASTNHQAIADAVSESLEELSQDIAFWNRQLSAHKDVRLLHHYVKELYVVVFEFLTEIFTNWSKSSFKRFLTSFDEKAINKLFTEKRGRIVAIERRMEREANLEFQRAMRAKVTQMVTDQQELHRAVLQGQDYSKQQANLIIRLGANFQQQTQPLRIHSSEDSFTGSDIQPSDAKIEAPTSLAIKAPELAPTLATPDPYGLELDNQNPSEAPIQYHREEILNELRTFLDRLGHDMHEIVEMTFCASHTMVDWRIRDHLLSWTRDAQPNRLWIQGPSGTAQPSQNRLTAVCLTALSRQNHIPCISYFCSPNHGRAMPRAFHEDALIEMLASLITQLALLLPKHFTASLDLSSSRFAVLKSDSPTYNSCLELLHDLRSLAPSYLHCIFDGVQVLENRSEPQHTQNLSNFILGLCTLDDERPLIADDKPTKTGEGAESSSLNIDREDGLTAQVTKICFTTDGYMDGLAQIAELHFVKKVEYNSEADELFAEDTAQFPAL